MFSFSTVRGCPGCEVQRQRLLARLHLTWVFPRCSMHMAGQGMNAGRLIRNALRMKVNSHETKI